MLTPTGTRGATRGQAGRSLASGGPGKGAAAMDTSSRDRDFHDTCGVRHTPWHGPPPRPTAVIRTATAVVLAVGASPAAAQSIEPRAYSNVPVGVNFLIGGYAYTRGGVSFDPALPVSDPRLTTSSAVLAYARALDLWGKSGKLDVVVPYTWLSGSASQQGERIDREVDGLGDPLLRLSVNVFGAPALRLPEFKDYEQDLILGASVQVSVPVGQYDETRLVNLGTNRWFFKPEIGASQALGRWTLEAQASVTFFTDNQDFFNGNTREQAPLYSLQGHAIYNFPRGTWASLDATYFAGGRTTLNGDVNEDRQQNWRVGATLAFPVDLRNSVKLYASRGVSARTGNSFDLIGVAWQYRWGGGL